MQQIIGFGEEIVPCQRVPLCAEGLPASLKPPYSLCDVRAAQQESFWQEDECRERRALLLCVGVPLLITVRGADGCEASAFATLNVKARLRLMCDRRDALSCGVQILPCVRLAGRVPASDTPCFDAPLSVRLLCYLLSPRAMPRPDCPPPCPPMPPMYPQPHR